MKLNNLLLEKRTAVVNKWLNAVYDTYPVDSSQFLKGQTDRFLNPVGHTFSQAIEGLFDEIISGDVKSDRVLLLLDDIIRIKAVQNFSPSEALSFAFLLKKVIREEFKKPVKEYNLFEELQEIESRVDEVALLAFNIYMKCKENIYDIRVNEVKTMTSRLLRRANLICDVGASEPENDLGTQSTQKIEG